MVNGLKAPILMVLVYEGGFLVDMGARRAVGELTFFLSAQPILNKKANHAIHDAGFKPQVFRNGIYIIQTTVSFTFMVSATGVTRLKLVIVYTPDFSFSKKKARLLNPD